MHRKATQAQVLVSTNWIADVSIRGVALFVSEPIDRHCQELRAILEIIIHVRRCGTIDVEPPSAEGFRASLVSCESAEPGPARS